MAPQFQSLSEFLAMGGHAPFVFGAWGLTFAVVLGLIITIFHNSKRQRARLTALERDK